MEKSVRVIKIDEVEVIVGIKRSSIYNKLNPRSPYFDEGFPRSIKLGASSVGWLEHEVTEWVMEKAAGRDLCERG